MPTLHPVRRNNIVRISAKVTNDPDAKITMSYVNEVAPNENFTLGPATEIDKKMIFDEIGNHTLVFIAVASLSATNNTFRVLLTDTDKNDEVVYDSGDLPFQDGFANDDVWLTPH